MFARSLRSTVASTSRLHLESALPRNTLLRSQATSVLSNGYATKSESEPEPKPRAKPGPKPKAKPGPKPKKASAKSGKKAKVEGKQTEEQPLDDSIGNEEDNINSKTKDVNFDNSSPEDLTLTSLSKSTLNTIGDGHVEFNRTFGDRKSQHADSVEQRAVSKVIPNPSHKDYPYVPKPPVWDKIFYKVNGINTRHRMFISNVETAKNVVKALELDKQREASGERITVIEGYPGIGSLSRELCNHEAVEKVIAFEDHASFNKALRNLKDNEPQAAEKLDVLPLSCFQWESFDQVVGLGGLDNIPGVREERKRQPDYKDGIFAGDSWKKPSSLLFLAQLPNTVHSEQLVSQLLRSISNRYWLYRHARVRMAFICSQQMAERCMAQVSDRLYGKLTLVAGAMADCTVALDSSHFKPYAEHFWPSKPAVGPQTPITVHLGSIKDHRQQATPAKTDQCLLILEPRVKPLIEGSSELESFDYITKNLFILRSSHVKKALAHIAPGADNILDAMNSGKHPAMQEIGNVTIDPKTIVSKLTLTQLIGLSKMFDRWPFRPANLFDEGRIEEIAEHRNNNR
ncbi:S-adenosyl-L-methionine-dependent methyltransferase [Meira miltonrushii]|uniref:rRNA adenine N(6)-methyltransferase n=1 Tax=Meira miltonrushii TaxID=1280837 RepID=A0A316V3Y6_9BASI|nr:S-adenosyl-L-methionine-dependent methyltransferase [Meira miltonrushii]PWN32256.1 S-adenosyl-L-methionine-dependent methyltransferase [Meira miltonrushii]